MFVLEVPLKTVVTRECAAAEWALLRVIDTTRHWRRDTICPVIHAQYLRHWSASLLGINPAVKYGGDLKGEVLCLMTCAIV